MNASDIAIALGRPSALRRSWLSFAVAGDGLTDSHLLEFLNKGKERNAHGQCLSGSSLRANLSLRCVKGCEHKKRPPGVSRESGILMPSRGDRLD
jgi:hypothetical protein